MSGNQLTQQQQTMVSAALRHVRDACLLARAGKEQSLDQAFHLAGFGPECMRKALLSDRAWGKVLGHRFDEDMEETLEAVLALDPVAHRYEPARWGDRWPALRTWTEQARYEKTGTRKAEQVQPLLQQASEAVNACLADYWADGRLPEDFGW